MDATPEPKIPGLPEIEWAKFTKALDNLPEVDRAITREILATVLKLSRDPVSRLDRKIINAALKEMRYAFRVFAPYRGTRKVSIFGSARTLDGDPAYEATKRFSNLIAERGWMVITGAGPGIMAAGHEGAGGERSFGVNIRLPFEADPNRFIAADTKLINFKYFFTRKLMFVKEADAFVLLPGGFGTMDEALELLTLIQTGKSELKPVVMLDPPGESYWPEFVDYLKRNLLERGYISERDLNLLRCVDGPTAAVDEIERFYRVYHSQRIVDRRLVLRLKTKPPPGLLEELSEEFSHMMTGRIETVEASGKEIADGDRPELPRIAIDFDWSFVGDLRRLVDRLNEVDEAGG